MGLFGSDNKFDEIPFGLLTMIVSLWVFLLSTLIMVNQDRQARRSGTRAQIDVESNMR